MSVTATILLAEDEPSVRRLMRATLERAGYNVLEVLDGEHALQVARRLAGPIDLLLSDVVMPRMRGDALAQRLRTLYPPIKVLFVTSHADLVNAADLEHELDYESVLLKPFKPHELVHRVREVLKGSPAKPATL